MERTHEKILILGIGNILLGDEGIGIHTVKYLEKQKLPENVVLLDGGTGGFYLLSVLENYKTVILIDACLDNLPAGTLTLAEPMFSSDFPNALSSHDIGLKDLIEAASLLHHLPKIYLITVSIKDFQKISMDLSPDVRKTLPEVCNMITSLLNHLY